MMRLLLIFATVLFSQLAHGQFTNVTVGSAANDGTGDNLRLAFQKLNFADNWLKTNLTTVSNLANGGSATAKMNTNEGTSWGQTLVSPITNLSLTASRVLILDSAKRQTNSTVTDTELGYVGGVTSSIQDQLDALSAGGGANTKMETNNGVSFGQTLVSPITNLTLTANRVLILDSAKRQTNSTVTDTELGYLSGVTSAVQTQLGTKLSATDIDTSAELDAIVTDDTGSGALVFANTPTLVTPVIGAATGTSLTLTGDLNADGVNAVDVVSTTVATDTLTAGEVNVGGDGEGTIALKNNAETFSFTFGVHPSIGTNIVKREPTQFWTGLVKYWDDGGVMQEAQAVAGTDYLGTSSISDTAVASSWNGVTTIAASKNAVWDRFYQQVSVKDFGVVGDGSDEGALIQTAIDASTNRVLFFPPGVYGTAQTLKIHQNTHILGSGWGGYYGLSTGTTNPAVSLVNQAGASVIFLRGAANVPMITNSTTAESLSSTTSANDGRGTVTPLLYNASIRNIVLHGNARSQTVWDADILRFTDAWGITIDGVKFHLPAGYAARLWNCNDVHIRNFNMLGESVRSKGFLFYDSADCTMHQGQAGGMVGPALWLATSTTWQNTFSDMDLGDAGASDSMAGVSSVSTNALTLTVDPKLQTGDPFTFWVDPHTGGSLSGDVTSGKTYFAIRWSETLFSFNDSLPDALAGTPDAISSVGTSMIMAPGGPHSAVYLSEARQNTLNNVRADGCRRVNVVFNAAGYNSYLNGKSTKAGYNGGSPIDGLGFWLFGGSGCVSNIIDGNILADNLCAARFDSAGNFWGDNPSRNVATNMVANVTTYSPVNQTSLGTVLLGATTIAPPASASTALSVQSTNNALVMDLTRIGTVSSGVKFRLTDEVDGIGLDAFQIANTSSEPIIQLNGNTTTRTLRMGGNSLATNVVTTIDGGTRFGTDIPGYGLIVRSPVATGNADPGQVILGVGIRKASGATYQTGVTNILVIGETAITATQPIVGTDATFTGALNIPNAAAPTTDAFGEIAGDNNAWAASRGAVQFFDGTANTWLIGALSSDTPSNGQVPKWNTGGTITWENDTGGSITGTDTHVMFFDGADTPSGEAGFTYNKTTDSATLAGSMTVANLAYNATTWNGAATAATRDDVRDQLIIGDTDADGKADTVDDSLTWPNSWVGYAYIIDSATSDQAITNSTTVVDSALSVAVEASKNYTFEFSLFFNQDASTSDPKISIVLPTSPTSTRYSTLVFNISALATASAIGTAGSVEYTVGTGNGRTHWVIKGVLINGSNAGNIKLQFANNVSGVTTLEAGSTLRVDKLN